MSIQISYSTIYTDVLDVALRLELRVKESQANRESKKKSRSERPTRSWLGGDSKAQSEPTPQKTYANRGEP